MLVVRLSASRSQVSNEPRKAAIIGLMISAAAGMNRTRYSAIRSASGDKKPRL